MNYKVLVPNSLDIEKLSSSFPEYQFSYDWNAEANCLIYDDSIENALCRVQEKDSLKHFISAQKALSLKEFDFHKIANAKLKFEMGFTTQTVSEVIGSIKKKLDELSLDDQFSDFGRYLHTIAVELVQNALIATGHEDNEKEVCLRLKENETFYEIEVIDNVGTLTSAMILDKLKRAHQEKTAEDKKDGAGLGLFMVLGASDQLIFEITPHSKTIVRSIINKYKRLKEYKRKKSSMHIYEGE